MKILWNGVPSRFTTGYGIQTNLFTRELKRQGHTVWISSVVPAMPTYRDNNGIDTLSNGPRPCMGNDFIDEHISHYEPDVVVSMTDTFVYDMKKWAKVPWVPWQVIDSAPLIPAILDRCKVAKHNLAMSKFGQQVMMDNDIVSTYIPLAYDPDAYNVTNKDIARERIKQTFDVDLTGKYVVMMNSANMSKPSRKNYGAAFKAFALFHKEHPDSVLYVHAEQTGKMFGQGENLLAIAKQYGLTEHELFFPPQYEYVMQLLTPEYMSMMYNASDVLLHAACGEGFGVPFVEAQACGLPVIAPHVSAVPELIHYGRTVKDGTMWMHVEGSEQFIVKPEALTDALIAEYNSGSREHRAVPEMAQYTIQNVMDKHFLPLLHRIKTGDINVKESKNEKETIG